jgi:hypothetical protein
MKSKSHKNTLQQFIKLLLEVKVRNHNRLPTVAGGGDRRNHSNNNNNIDSDEQDMLDDDQISVHSKNNYFEIMCNFCFLNNEDPSQLPPPAQKGPSTVESFKTPTDFHDLYVDKIQFFIDTLQLLTEIHIIMFT